MGRAHRNKQQDALTTNAAVPRRQPFWGRGVFWPVGCAAIMVLLWWRWFPGLFFSGEMYAEAARNYFCHARYDSIGVNLVSYDHVYLPVLLRSLALGIEALHMPTAWTGYAYQLVALTLAVVGMTALSWPVFRRLIPSDSLRALLCLGMLSHAGYDGHSFINSPYWLAPLFFLALLVLPYTAVPKSRWGRGGLMGLAALLALGKPCYVAFLPACLLLGGRAWRRGARAVGWIYATASVALGGQLMIMAHNRKMDLMMSPAPLADLIELAMGYPKLLALATLGWQHTGLLPPQMGGLALVQWFGAWVATAACLVALRPSFMRRLVSPLTIGGSAVLLATWLGTLPFPNYFPGGRIDPALFEMRWFIMPALVAYLTVALVMHAVYGRFAALPLAAWLTATAPLGLRVPATQSGWGESQHAQWQALAPVIFEAPKPQRFCIPIDPYPWVFTRNCQRLTGAPPLSAVNWPLGPQPPMGWTLPSSAAHWQVDSVSMLLQDTLPSGLTLALYDATNHLLARVAPRPRFTARYTIFFFAAPVTGVARLHLEGPGVADVRIAQYNGEAGLPAWEWFGRP